MNKEEWDYHIQGICLNDEDRKKAIEDYNLGYTGAKLCGDSSEVRNPQQTSWYEQNSFYFKRGWFAAVKEFEKGVRDNA